MTAGMNKIFITGSDFMNLCTLGDRIAEARTIRNQNGYQTIEQVSYFTGISADKIAGFERGDFTGLSVQDAVCLSNHYGVSIEYLLEGRGSEKPLCQCAACGRRFVPKNRTDTKYCDFPHPVFSDMSCRQWSKSKSRHENIKKSATSLKAHNIGSKKGMMYRRHPENVDMKQDYYEFLANRAEWEKMVKDGTRTDEDFLKWLDSCDYTLKVEKPKKESSKKKPSKKKQKELEAALDEIEERRILGGWDTIQG